ncbi:serine hydrolase domain-containing protein [Rhodohalobacter mucosus]|uniref:Beta-lactamase-related domain-containing protein n=1 Tax=Rhodohalobacter mucosus TaxID=2079485 RepID=A0A316TVU6_9BACT|nr:serine hydrolase domain-containing protein [Rhodohalobacter mucosus]PWN07285.1 hypothetical protein DDZ15_03185 [Rhodohalobacter mucosus]
MKNIKSLLLPFLFLFLFLSALVGCTAGNQETDSQELSEYFDASTLPAAVMGSVSATEDTEWHTFGPSVWDEEEAVTEDHIFRIFSMTKAITSVAAMQLVEQGLIGLDEPLNELMPELASIPILTESGELVQSDAPVTLRQLLTHTAGFGYDFTSERLAAFNPDDWEYADKPRLFEPGARWHYGTSTDWAGKVVEKVSGQDLETYFRENITGPLGMDRTWFNVPDSLKENIVSWGTRDSTGFSEYDRIPQQPAAEYSGGGGLYGSPADYLTFLTCLLNDGQYENGQILQPETVAMLFENQLPEGMTMDHNLPEEGLPPVVGAFPDETDTFGLAWAIEASEDEDVRSKGAAYWAGIANSYYTIDRVNGIAVVYFTQFLPFNDKESHDFYRLYEEQVFSGMGIGNE